MSCKNYPKICREIFLISNFICGSTCKCFFVNKVCLLLFWVENGFININKPPQKNNKLFEIQGECLIIINYANKYTNYIYLSISNCHKKL